MNGEVIEIGLKDIFLIRAQNLLKENRTEIREKEPHIGDLKFLINEVNVNERIKDFATLPLSSSNNFTNREFYLYNSSYFSTGRNKPCFAFVGDKVPHETKFIIENKTISLSVCYGKEFETHSYDAPVSKIKKKLNMIQNDHTIIYEKDILRKLRRDVEFENLILSGTFSNIPDKEQKNTLVKFNWRALWSLQDIRMSLEGPDEIENYVTYVPTTEMDNVGYSIRARNKNSDIYEFDRDNYLTNYKDLSLVYGKIGEVSITPNKTTEMIGLNNEISSTMTNSYMEHPITEEFKFIPLPESEDVGYISKFTENLITNEKELSCLKNITESENKCSEYKKDEYEDTIEHIHLPNSNDTSLLCNDAILETSSSGCLVIVKDMVYLNVEGFDIISYLNFTSEERKNFLDNNVKIKDILTLINFFNIKKVDQVNELKNIIDEILSEKSYLIFREIGEI